jgi:hypothetical protein
VSDARGVDPARVFDENDVAIELEDGRTERRRGANVRHEVFTLVRLANAASLDDAHDLAMAAKEAIFRAQDACSLAWEREPEKRAVQRKVEKRLAKIRAELEALDRDVLAARWRSRR